MLSAFKQIFEIRMQHNFYTDNRCVDFSFFPLGETVELLRNHQAVFRSDASTIRTLILADQSQTNAQRPIDKDASLFFGMTLNNPGFSNFTNEYPSSKKIFLFSNSTNLNNPSLAPVELTRKEISLSGSVITHIINTNLAVSLILKNAAGAVIETKNFNAGSKDSFYQFDIQRQSKGLYTVTEDTGASIVYTYYCDADLLFNNIFGIIQIVNQSTFTFSYDGKPVYTISFTSRSSAWSYYVVAQGMSGADINNFLNLFDSGRVGPAVINFTKTYPVPANDTTAPLLCSDISKVILFTSNNALVWQQAPRKGIQLRKNATILLSDLPNPNWQNPGTKMNISI